MTTIESRLAAVERQLYFHRAVIATLLVALVALVGYGATEGVPEVIRARKFEVIDDSGDVAGKIFYRPKWGSIFQAYAFEAVSNNKVYAKLNARFEMGTLDLTNATVTVPDNNVRNIRLQSPLGLFVYSNNDNKLFKSFAIELGPKGIPTEIRTRKLVVVNKNDNEVVKLLQSPSGDGWFVIGSSDGTTRLIINSSDFGGLVRGFSSNKNEAYSIGVDVNNNGYLDILNNAGKRIIRAGAGLAGGAISIHNKTGEEVVEVKADEYGMGYVGAFNRQGKGRVLKPR